jgi:hypothetical protein
MNTAANTRRANAVWAPQRRRIQSRRHGSRLAACGVAHHRDLYARGRDPGARSLSWRAGYAVDTRRSGCSSASRSRNQCSGALIPQYSA